MDTQTCKKCEGEFPIDEFKFKKRTCYTCQKALAREWKARNKERTLTYTQEWKAQHRAHVSAYNAAYDAKNRETINKRVTAYHVARAKVDPNFKLAKTLRNRYRMVLKEGRLDESSLTLLGCSIDNFKDWLSFRFEDDMTFENHGSVWDLDHVVPISKFDLQDEEEIRKCFHWTNFQPLYQSQNRSKNHRVTVEEIENHESQLQAFLDDLPAMARAEYTMIEIERIPYAQKPPKQRSSRGATKVSQE